MRTGHILTILGVALYLVGAITMPWQTFELAQVSATSLEVSALGLVGAGIAGLIGLLSVFALLSGHRKVTAFSNIGLLSLLFVWVLYSSVNAEHSFVLMQHEEVKMATGYVLGIWGVVVSVLGTLLTLTTLPAWDASSPFLRVLTLHKGKIVGDKILYEPGLFSTAEHHGKGVSDQTTVAMLPHFRVTSEGDCAIGFASTAAGKPGRVSLSKGTKTVSEVATKGRKSSGVAYTAFGFGERGTVDLGDTQVNFHFVAPVPGHSPAPLLQTTEVGAFAMFAGVVMLALFLVPVLGWSAEAKREATCEDGKCGGAVAEVQKEEKIEVAEVIPEPEAEVEMEEDVSKKAGGEEGKFGDPNMDPRVESKIPLMDGKMVEKIDPRQIGLNKLLTENLGSMDAVAEVLKGDMGAMSSKLAVAMGGSGSEFVLGHGSGGLGFTGDGSGGGGDGAGRIMGMGDIDTGGGQGVKAGLGDKGKKRVGNLQLSGSTSSGFCKKGNIESVVKRRAAAIRACYEQRLQVKKDLKGKISIRWTINTEGKVDGASSTGDTMGDGETTNCILRTVRRMQFEKPEGGVCVVQWPFVFSPG